jgi:gas vesicle protein
MAGTIDIFLAYKIIKALTTPFEETEAFKAGLIDANGKKLKNASTQKEKDSLSYFDRIIFNMKRILVKFGLGSRIATFAAALLLLREDSYKLREGEVLREINENIKYLKENEGKNYSILKEEIANVTGNAVAGTGETGEAWSRVNYRVGVHGERRKIGRYINGVTFLKRTSKVQENK